MRYWQHKLRYVGDKLQELVEVEHQDCEGDACRIEHEWRNVPDHTEIDANGEGKDNGRD